jgi:hypothetical protein
MSNDNQAAVARAQQQAADRLKQLERQGTTDTAEYRRLAERSFRIANR